MMWETTSQSVGIRKMATTTNNVLSRLFIVSNGSSEGNVMCRGVKEMRKWRRVCWIAPVVVSDRKVLSGWIVHVAADRNVRGPGLGCDDTTMEKIRLQPGRLR